MSDRDERLKTANAFLEIIAAHGRRFFHHEGRVGRLEQDERKRLWFVDQYTQKRVYTHETTWLSRWPGFTGGGTMRQIVEALRDYVMGRAPLPTNHLGPWKEWVNGGDLWGYGAEEMAKVRAAVGLLSTKEGGE